MSTNRDKYIELYSVAMEEARHHDRLYTQTWTSGIIALGVVLAALGLAKEFSPVFGALPAWPVVGLGSLIILMFYWSTCRHGSEGRKCRDIARRIEDILAGNTPEESIKLDNLLIMKKVKEMRDLRDKDIYSPLVDPVWRIVYLVVLLVFWISLSLFLLGNIG